MEMGQYDATPCSTLVPNKQYWNLLVVFAKMVGRCLGGWNETSALVLRMASLTLAVSGKCTTPPRPTCLENIFLSAP